MASIYRKGLWLYASVKDEHDEWIAERTPHQVGEEAKAKRWAVELQRIYDAKPRASEAIAEKVTLDAYAATWIAKRRARGLRSAGDDESRLALHVLPVLGHLELGEIRPRHVRELVEALQEKQTARKNGKLAPRTILHVFRTLSLLYKSAVVDERVSSSPVVVDGGVLPQLADKDPAWRDGAVFTRKELETLISDEGTVPDRRVLYAIKGLAALRHGEASRLRWRDYDVDAEPLGAFVLSVTKTKVPRRMPVHPTLAKILAAWKLSGWRAVYGRQPKDEDLIVPTHAMTERAPAESQAQFLADLKRLELRHRRGHDFRRTFISLAQVDGARRDLLKVVTHGPSRNDMMSAYSTFPWPSLCAEVAKLRIQLRGVSTIAKLSVAVAAGSRAAETRWRPDLRSTAFLPARSDREIAEENWRPQRDSNPAKSSQNSAQPTPLTLPKATTASPDEPALGAAVENLSTALSRAVRGGNLTRARVLLDQLGSALAKEEEKR